MGIPIPSADRAEILTARHGDEVSTDAKMSEFMAGISTLVNAAFTGDDAIVAQKSMQVARAALSNIFGDAGGVQTGFHGDSAKIERKDKVHIAAAYTSTSFCRAQDWSTDKDFYVSRYVFTVFQVPEPHVRALLRVRSL